MWTWWDTGFFTSSVSASSMDSFARLAMTNKPRSSGKHSSIELMHIILIGMVKQRLRDPMVQWLPRVLAAWGPVVNRLADWTGELAGEAPIWKLSPDLMAVGLCFSGDGVACPLVLRCGPGISIATGLGGTTGVSGPGRARPLGSRARSSSGNRRRAAKILAPLATAACAPRRWRSGPAP